MVTMVSRSFEKIRLMTFSVRVQTPFSYQDIFQQVDASVIPTYSYIVIPRRDLILAGHKNVPAQTPKMISETLYHIPIPKPQRLNAG
jgi:hypothetical protein